jgi:hypothetical protein
LAPQLLCFKVVDAYFIENVQWFYFSRQSNTTVAAFVVVVNERKKKFFSGTCHNTFNTFHKGRKILSA